MVARTTTSTNRLLDALRFFANDFRVNLAVTINDTSKFSSGVERVLHGADVHRIVPWRDVRNRAIEYHLAVSASENIDFEWISTRTVVLPHGLGFNKHVPTDVPGATRLAGLPPVDVLRDGRALVVLSHPEQDAQLRAACPEVAGNTAVVGDHTYDRLLASRPLRERYRRLLGVAGRRLVLVSSTWGRQGQLGVWGSLTHQLLAELPADEYQVAAVLHPNIWARHTPLQVRIWHEDALAAGLLLLPPTRGWQAALLAADLVIADHGSLALYAAALGTPLLLAAFGDEVVPGTPVAQLGASADRLDRRLGLRDQVEHALATHRADRFAAITNRVFARVGESTRLLRDLLYRELGLAPPPSPPVLSRVDDPVPDLREVTAFSVHSEFVDASTLRLWRYPAAVQRLGDPDTHRQPLPANAVRHLAVDEAEADLTLPQNASVLVRRDVGTAAEAAGWTANALENHPGARVAAGATAEGCLARLRDGRLVRVRVTGPPPDPMLLASAVYAALRAGRLHSGGFTVCAGAVTAPVTLDVRG
ncbi:hypothetical protein LX83_000882 [Goodfellowiella coeruleoviolacea]|uniref:Translation initiation factor 2 n=1 Tax=Goodfellowiella coeruleoviolacea TaxID=334858 RepID=A0AAE3G9B1_9PSEU|nr:hypothetical protein [Goodfellowiella coeruleoviolacea]